MAVIESDFQEQREHLRIKASWKTKVTRTNQHSLTVRLNDISRGGGHIISDVNFNKGEALLMESRPLINGKTIPIKLVAKVAHTHLLNNNQGIGAGFYFTRTSESFQRLINHLEEG